MEKISDYKEIRDLIIAKGGETFNLCYECGLCETVCPWNKIKLFSIRKMIKQARLGITDIGSEDIWRCTTCGKCLQECPRDVRQIEAGNSLRRIATEYGIFPKSIQSIRHISASLLNKGNPLNEEQQNRAHWTEGLNIKNFTEQSDFLYFPGCYLCYEPRLKKIARATANILNLAGINFGILGIKEFCCGESIRKTGDEELFKKLAKKNINSFIENGVKKILVSSPHCYHVFKNEYTEFKVNFEVIHITQFLFSLIKEKKIHLRNDYKKEVTYHDPCYLGRHNNIYTEPREILNNIPGLILKEMNDTMKDSLCCGGGGGRIWIDTPKGERFSDIRIQQAIEIKAKELITTCPYCISNFEESRVNLNFIDDIIIKDITEVLEKVIYN